MMNLHHHHPAADRILLTAARLPPPIVVVVQAITKDCESGGGLFVDRTTYTETIMATSMGVGAMYVHRNTAAERQNGKACSHSKPQHSNTYVASLLLRDGSYCALTWREIGVMELDAATGLVARFDAVWDFAAFSAGLNACFARQ